MGVQCFKLMSGEEIVGDIINDFKDVVIKVRNPALIHMVPSPQDGSIKIGLIPFATYSEEDTITIAKEALSVLPFSPATEFLNRYNQIFGSGIQIAQGALN